MQLMSEVERMERLLSDRAKDVQFWQEQTQQWQKKERRTKEVREQTQRRMLKMQEKNRSIEHDTENWKAHMDLSNFVLLHSRSWLCLFDVYETALAVCVPLKVSNHAFSSPKKTVCHVNIKLLKHDLLKTQEAENEKLRNQIMELQIETQKEGVVQDEEKSERELTREKKKLISTKRKLQSFISRIHVEFPVIQCFFSGGGGVNTAVNHEPRIFSKTTSAQREIRSLMEERAQNARLVRKINQTFPFSSFFSGKNHER